MYPIKEKKRLSSNLVQMKIEAPLIAKKAQPGQFIILRVNDEGERIPLTIADYDRDLGLITIIFQEVGLTTNLLGQLEEGQSITDFAGPLGLPSQIHTDGRVLCIGGGVGTAVVYPQVKFLHERGVAVDVIVGARSREHMILEEEIRGHCSNLYITTDDGSYVRKGFVTDVLQELIDRGEHYDEVLAIGPPRMMQAVVKITKQHNIKTTVSMNPIMVDGTGMCGGCRITVGGETKYACVDGPDFDGFLVDFDEMIRRSQMYRDEEQHALEFHPCGGVFHHG